MIHPCIWISNYYEQANTQNQAHSSQKLINYLKDSINSILTFKTNCKSRVCVSIPNLSHIFSHTHTIKSIIISNFKFKIVLCTYLQPHSVEEVILHHMISIIVVWHKKYVFYTPTNMFRTLSLQINAKTPFLLRRQQRRRCNNKWYLYYLLSHLCLRNYSYSQKYIQVIFWWRKGTQIDISIIFYTSHAIWIEKVCATLSKKKK